jgi:pSer/pThr/pTyr-binding forkhead associated (FHA) protein
MSTRISKPKFCLEGTKGLLKGHTIELDTTTLEFGRTSQNDIRLAENPVSRKHAKIWLDHGGVWLEDMGSKNGTLLNDRLITPGVPTRVNLHDVVTLGSSSFRLVQLTNAVSSVPVDFDDAPDPTRTRHPHSIEEYLAKAQSPFSKPPSAKPKMKFKFSLDQLSKRQKMYGGLGLFLLAIWITTLIPTSQTTTVTSLSSYQQETPKPMADRPDINLNGIEPPPLDQVPLLLAQAKSAMRFEDYRHAMALYAKVLTVRQQDPTVESFWKIAQSNMYAQIQKHETLAAMEYQKLEYEQALMHWRRVLELAENFDQDIYVRTQETIASLENEIRSL